MAITKLDAVLEAIEQGKTNDEIRDEIDGRLSDKRLDSSASIRTLGPMT